MKWTPNQYFCSVNRMGRNLAIICAIFITNSDYVSKLVITQFYLHRA